MSRDEILTALIISLVVVAGSVLLYLLSLHVGRRFVDRMGVRSDEHGRRAATLWSMLRRVAAIVILVVAVLSVMSLWRVPLAPFLAVGSAVGVAVGFGAQSLVKDVIAGFFILAEDQFHIGDVIRVAGVAGAVHEIRLRVTVLRDHEGNVHYVPNGEIKVATNLTKDYAQVVIDIGVGYREDIDRVLSTVEDEVAQFAQDWSERLLPTEPQILGVERLDEGAVIIRMVVPTLASERWAVRRELLRRLKNRFDAAGIEIPNSHLSLYRSGEGTAVHNE